MCGAPRSQIGRVNIGVVVFTGNDVQGDVWKEVSEYPAHCDGAN